MEADHTIAVFGASAVSPGDVAYEEAVAAGALLAEAGFGVATGGYGGVMEAAALGASRAGGTTIGVTAPPIFPGRDGPNPHIITEFPAQSLTQRLHQLVESAAGFLVMPGSIGTLTELVVVWNSAFVTRYSGENTKPVATVGEPWSSLVPLLADRLGTDASLVACHDDVASAVADLVSRLAQ